MTKFDSSNASIMSANEFNQRVKDWGETVRSRSLGTLVAETNVYSGELRSRLKSATNTARDDGLAHAVAFKFVRYGVFVAYGVGNGYIRLNGREGVPPLRHVEIAHQQVPRPQGCGAEGRRPPQDGYMYGARRLLHRQHRRELRVHLQR